MEFEVKQVTPAPAAQPTAPPAAQPQLKIPTPDEVVQRTIDSYAAMGWGKPSDAELRRVKEEAIRFSGQQEEAQAAAAAAAAPAAQAPAAQAPAAEPEVEEPPVAEPLSTEEIIARTASETARAVAEAVRPAAQPQAQPEVQSTSDLSPEDQRDLDIVRYMEKMNPAEHPGLGDTLLKYYRDHYAYIDKWLQDHPGAEFDAGAEEHQAWYEANEPEIDRNAMKRAEVDMLVERKFEQKVQPEREAEKRKQALAQSLPDIAVQINSKVADMVSLVDPTLGKLLRDDKGKVAMTEENIAKVEEADPIAKEVIDQIVNNELEPLLFELEKSTVKDLGYRFDATNNSMHRAIWQFVDKREQALAKAAPAQRMLDGRNWMSLSDYSAQMNAIKKGAGTDSERQQKIAELNSRVWTLSADMIESLMVDFYAKKAKAEIERRDTTAKKKFKVTKESVQTPPAAQTVPPAQPAVNTGQKPRSPAIGSQADLVTTGGAGSGTQKTYGEQAAEIHFGR